MPAAPRPFRRSPAWLAALFLSAATGPSAALDELVLRAPGADQDLRDALGAASLLTTSVAEKQTEAQDLFAAARSEYGRLLGALYAEGYYSGTIRVLIDGREAASIAQGPETAKVTGLPDVEAPLTVTAVPATRVTGAPGAHAAAPLGVTVIASFVGAGCTLITCESLPLNWKFSEAYSTLMVCTPAWVGVQATEPTRSTTPRDPPIG